MYAESQGTFESNTIRSLIAMGVGYLAAQHGATDFVTPEVQQHLTDVVVSVGATAAAYFRIQAHKVIE